MLKFITVSPNWQRLMFLKQHNREVRLEKKRDVKMRLVLVSVQSTKAKTQCAQRRFYDIEATRQQVVFDIEAIREKNLRNHVANLEETISTLDVNQGLSGMCRTKLFEEVVCVRGRVD